MERLVIAFVLMAAAAAGPTWAADGSAPDFGFEDVTSAGGFRRWMVNSQYPFKRVEVVHADPRYVRSGRYALKLVATNGKSGHLYTRSAVAVKPNGSYTFSLWAKGDGSVSAMAYLYSITEGKEGFRTSVYPASAPPSDGQLSDVQWRQFTYKLAPGSPHAEIKTARLVIVASGTVYIDDCSFAPAEGLKAAEPKPSSSPKGSSSPGESTIRPNLISISSGGTAPRIDGRINDDEYRTRATGMINSTTQRLYAFDHTFCLFFDQNRFYFALRLQLPHGYELRTSKHTRDDSALVANKDVFYFFLRRDSDHTAKAFEGVYVAVAPDGVIYDCWERIDWAGSRCERDASFNANWQIATNLDDDIWTLEMSAPWKDLRFALPKEEITCLMAFGMNLQATRISWQTAPNWFDHYQAFGRLRLTRDGMAIEAPSLGEVARGALRPHFRLANAGDRRIDYELTYLVSTPKMIGGGVGNHIFDHTIDVRRKEVIRDKSVYYWNPYGSLEAGQSKSETTESRLTAPQFYVLELEGRANGRPVLYQKIPFEYSPPIRGTLTPVPSKDLIYADLAFHGAQSEEKGTARIVFTNAIGKVILSHQVAVISDEMRAPLSMAKLPPGDYTVRFVLADKVGKPVSTATTSFKKWATPAWLKHRAGLEALAPEWVPDPWIPVTMSGDQVSLWGRRFELRPGALIANIESQRVPLLTSGIQVKYRIGGKEYTFDINGPSFPMRKRGRVQVEQKGTSPHFSLSARQQIEFDGMDRFDVRIAPMEKVIVDLLWIEIPFRDFPYSAFSARQGAGGGCWQHGLASDQLFAAPRNYTWIWLGDDSVGCVYFAENYKGWLIHSAKPRVALHSTERARTLKLLIVNEPSEIDAPLSFTFGLHPTPFKPRFAGWRAIRPQGMGMTPPPTNLVMVHSSIWNSCDSKPSPKSWQALDDMLDFLHGRGQKAFPYLGALFISPYNCINPDSPFDRTQSTIPQKWRYNKKKGATRQEEYFYFAEDWHLSPRRVVEAAWETRQEARVSPSGSWTDYFVHGIYEMLRRSDLDGVYLDIANPMTNFDEAKGLAVATKDGVIEGTSELFATRDLYKRLYYVFEKARGPRARPWMLGHGFAASAPYSSFWAINFNGEEIKPTSKFQFTRMCLQKSLEGNPAAIVKETDDSRDFKAFSYRAIFGRQFGIPTMILPQYAYIPKLKLVEHSREMLSFTFIHNNLLWPAYIPAGTVYEFWNKVEVPFGMGDTTFHPYWENDIVATPDCIKISYWKKHEKADYLVAAANWNEDQVVAKVALPPVLRARTRCLDVEREEYIPVTRQWQIAIPPHDLRVFRFSQ